MAIGLFVAYLEYRESIFVGIDRVKSSFFPFFLVVATGLMMSYIFGRFHYYDRSFYVEDIELIQLETYESKPYVYISYLNGRKKYTVSYIDQDSNLVHENLTNHVTISYSNLIDTPYISKKYQLEERNKNPRNNWLLLLTDEQIGMDFKSIIIHTSKSKTLKQ